jgi:hypothetical protein
MLGHKNEAQYKKIIIIKSIFSCQAWGHIPLIVALRNLRQKICKFQDSLGYTGKP